MARHLYRYANFFGYLGSGTPEDPGSDFGMCVWIEAPDERAALDWGRVLLADYTNARHRHDGSGAHYKPGDIEGWIEEDEATIRRAEGEYPLSLVGEIPTWDAPWRIHNGRSPTER